MRSFGHAFRGWGLFLKEKGHARIHHLAVVVAIIISLWLHISRSDWLWIGLAITLVYTAEMINSALEELIDHIHPERSEPIRNVKDRLAAVVLICSLFALIIAILIWSEYI
jgi:diacylglycerol kinase